MTTFRRLALLIAFASALLVASVALAQGPTPSIGDPCVHVVPSGSTIYADTGEVYNEHGTLIATYGPCNPNAVDGGTSGSGGGAEPETCFAIGTSCSGPNSCGSGCTSETCNTEYGVCAASFYAESVEGVAAKSYEDAGTMRDYDDGGVYNSLQGYWVVPENAESPHNANITYYWNGLVNGNNGTLMQPELTYGSVGWRFQSQVVQPPSMGNYADGGVITGGTFTTPPVDTTNGHTIYGELLLEDGSTEYGDEWLILTQDTTADVYTYLLYYTGVSAVGTPSCSRCGIEES